MENEKKTAIIIGAGPAGLCAAYTLLTETDIIPVIFEESDFIGGISRTIEHNGNRMDIGGHRFFSKSEEVNEFWQKFMPVQGAPSIDDKILETKNKELAKDGPDPEKEDNVLLIRNRVSRIYYLKKFFDYPISLKFQTFKNMGFARTMKAGFGYIHSAMFKKEEDSLKNFYINRFGKPLYEMFFEDYTEKVWGRNPDSIDASWGAQRVKGLSLRSAIWAVLSKPFKKNKNNVETSLIEQYVYPKKGPGQLWEAVADEVERLGGKIVKNCSVEKIETDGKKILSVGINKNSKKETVSADYYFSSMPIKDLISGMGDIVPADIHDIAVNLPYRDFITVGLLVNKLKIKNETKTKTIGNIVPDCWIYIQEKGVKLGRLQIFNNWSPYMVKDFENNVWIGLEYFCNEGDELWNMDDKAFIDFAADELSKIGIIDKEDILDSVRAKVKKAYPAYFGTYSEFDKVKDYLSGIDNLYCIGRNGQHRYNNMDHSMMTAFEAVRALKRGDTSRDVVWNVNTEKEYHEEKK